MNTVDPFNLCANPDREKQELEARESNIVQIEKDIKFTQGIYEKKQALADKVWDKLEALKGDLKAACDHKPEYVKEESKYFGGSYTDLAYTEQRAVCTRCGATSESQRTTHSWYG